MEQIRWHWLILPMLVAFLGTLVPSLLGIILSSFHPYADIAELGPEWTLANYLTVFSDPFYLRALSRTLGLGAMTMLGTLIIGFPLAYAVVRIQSRIISIVFSMLYISSLTSIVIRGLGWITLLGTNGPINRLLLDLRLITEPIAFTGNIYGATLGMIHYMLPFMVLTLIPVVQMISPLLEEAAGGLGASFLRTFFVIVLPLAAPGIVAGCLLVFAVTIGSFVIPRMIGGVTMNVMSIMIEQQMLTTFNYAIGATLASILFFLVLAIVLATSVIFRERGSEA